MRTPGAPESHGAGVTGMQGAGVGTPNATAVAAMTAGLAGLLHIPKGWMFSAGTLSMIVPHGRPQALTRFFGSRLKFEGSAPKLH